MRLVNLGLGEIADRLSILALKIAHAAQEGKDATHFVNERNALLTQLRTYALEAGAEALFALAAVNAMLWHAEDDLRDYRTRVKGDAANLQDNAVYEAATIAFRIQALNDQRADLVRALNKSAGTDLGAEKL